jgi:YkoY family integral membrane protein
VPFDVQASDLLVIGLLIILEGILSADNALVLAILVLGLPREQQTRALRYGIGGAFVFRTLAILLAAYLIRVPWITLAGGIYLLYLSYGHFSSPRDAGRHKPPPPARAAFGLSPFWATVVRVELIDIVFSVDSILVAVALSPKLWVIITGGILGIIAMRLVAGRLIALIRRYPALVDGAFIIIAWVGLKLLLDYAHQMHWVGWQVPKTISLGLVVVIFVVSFIYARRQGPQDQDGPELPPALDGKP